MGVSTFWQALVDAVHEEVGASVFGRVDGLTIAVDLSIWLLEAQKQTALNDFSAEGKCLKIVFERVLNWLRCGCLPVFVLEGNAPAEKAACTYQRANGGAGNGTSVPWMASKPAYFGAAIANGTFRRLHLLVRDMLQAMGLPVVQASGEAEATCAALNACGLVDGCHTKDSDAFLFGAQVVYKHLHIQVEQPKLSKLSVCHMQQVRQHLGLTRGGAHALIAMAQLMGGDYDQRGADRVGHVTALAAVRSLLNGAQDDSEVLTALGAALQQEPDAHLLSLNKCTGCKECGHASHHKRTGCPECGTDKGCVAREWRQDGCACEFHRRSDERWLAKILERARSTPGFLTACSHTMDTYLTQARHGVESVEQHCRSCLGKPASECKRENFRWMQRPNVMHLSSLIKAHMGSSTTGGWRDDGVHRKLLPLLIEWDVRQGPSPHASSGVEYRPSCIRRLVGSKAEEAWRYQLDLVRVDGQVEELLTQLPTGGGAGGASQGAGDGEDEEAGSGDEEDARSASNAANNTRARIRKACAVRVSLVRRLWPDLVTQFEAPKPAKVPKPRVSKADGAPRGQRRLDDMFAKSKQLQQQQQGGFDKGSGDVADKGQRPLQPLSDVEKLAILSGSASTSGRGSPGAGAGGGGRGGAKRGGRGSGGSAGTRGSGTGKGTATAAAAPGALERFLLPRSGGAPPPPRAPAAAAVIVAASGRDVGGSPRRAQAALPLAGVHSPTPFLPPVDLCQLSSPEVVVVSHRSSDRDWRPSHERIPGGLAGPAECPAAGRRQHDETVDAEGDDAHAHSLQDRLAARDCGKASVVAAVYSSQLQSGTAGIACAAEGSSLPQPPLVSTAAEAPIMRTGAASESSTMQLFRQMADEAAAVPPPAVHRSCSSNSQLPPQGVQGAAATSTCPAQSLPGPWLISTPAMLPEGVAAVTEAVAHPDGAVPSTSLQLAVRHSVKAGTQQDTITDEGLGTCVLPTDTLTAVASAACPGPAPSAAAGGGTSPNGGRRTAREASPGAMFESPPKRVHYTAGTLCDPTTPCSTVSVDPGLARCGSALCSTELPSQPPSHRGDNEGAAYGGDRMPLMKRASAARSLYFSAPDSGHSSDDDEGEGMGAPSAGKLRARVVGVDARAVAAAGVQSAGVAPPPVRHVISLITPPGTVGKVPGGCDSMEAVDLTQDSD